MSKLPFPLAKFWSKKFGYNETIILTEYFLIMKKQFFNVKYPFEIELPIQFCLDEMHNFFPELKTPEIKKALLSLKNQNVLEYDGKIETCNRLFFLNHKDLFQDYIDFGGCDE